MKFNTDAQYDRLGDDNEFELQKHNTLETFEQPTVTKNASERDQAGGHHLRRFYLRGLVGVLGPLIVTGYFIAIWRIYLVPTEPDNAIIFGPPAAKWVFYSWFVVGVFGLNVSLYGLKGAEASMLMEPRWNVGDGKRLMLHASNDWDGPSGWIKTIRWCWNSRSSGRMRLPAKLWFILALPSILVFIALTLSGLSMEMTQGFLEGKKTSEGPLVRGFAWAGFNKRSSSDITDGARTTWKAALDARVLGHGVVYTPEGFDRSQVAYLGKLPTILPKDDGVQRIFLTPQAEGPIQGDAWGLLMQYNCSVVDKIDQFQILNHRDTTLASQIINGFRSYKVNSGSGTIAVRNKTQTRAGKVENIRAILELGSVDWPNSSAYDALSDTYNRDAVTHCYFHTDANITGLYPGIDDEQVFEALLWQHLNHTVRGDAELAPQYNSSLDHNITTLYGAYATSDWIGSPPGSNSTQDSLYPQDSMSAIGVQCRISNAVGTARINGRKSTYTNFQRTDTPPTQQIDACAPRLGANTPRTVMDIDKDEWLSGLFTSVSAAPPFFAKFTTDPKDLFINDGYLVQLTYLQADQLRQSLLRAFAAYAVQLMYNGGREQTTFGASHVVYNNPNVTEYVKDTVLTVGVMPASVCAVLFVLWALVASVLGVSYGFRRRWSAILDGYAMFRLGISLDEHVKQSVERTSNTLESEDCAGLDQAPGLIGDAQPQLSLGKIALVKRSPAVKDKMYE